MWYEYVKLHDDFTGRIICIHERIHLFNLILFFLRIVFYLTGQSTQNISSVQQLYGFIFLLFHILTSVTFTPGNKRINLIF